MSSPKKPRKSKYIELMMNKAEMRKKEKEFRIEKKIQKEREAEGDQFLDKEAFLTSSYKQKLIEMKKFQEENDAEEEVIGNLHDFYRNILDEKKVDHTFKKETASSKRTVTAKVKNESIDLNDSSKQKEKLFQNVKKENSDWQVTKKQNVSEEVKENSEISDFKKKEVSRSEKIMELLKKRTVGEIFEEKRQRYLMRLEKSANDKMNRDSDSGNFFSCKD